MDSISIAPGAWAWSFPLLNRFLTTNSTQRESLGGRTVDQLSPILGASRQLAGFSMDAFDEELGAMGFGKQRYSYLQTDCNVAKDLGCSRVDTFSICTSVPTPPIPEADPSEARELLDYYDEIREAGGYQETF